MKEIRDIPRWPVPELILLALFPVLFAGPDVIQQVYGRLPHWMQFLLPFTIAGCVVLSASRLTSRASQAKATGHTVLCAICAVLGFLALAVAALLIFSLGAGPWAFGFLAIGIIPAMLIVYSKQIWKMSNKTRKDYVARRAESE